MNRKVGVILSYILMIFEVLSTLLLTPFIIRTLGDSEYGVYKLSAAIVAYLLLLDLGVGNAVTRYVAKYRAQGNVLMCRRFLGITTVYYAAIAALCLAVGVVLYFLYPSVFATGLSEEEIALGQKLLSITIINTAITLGCVGFKNAVIAYERFDVSRGMSIIMIIVRIGCTFAALKLGFGSIGIVSVNLGMTITTNLVFALFVIFKLKLKPIFRGITASLVKEVAVYSSFILIQMIATQINAFADQVLLGMFIEASAVIIAIYSVGQQITQYFQSIGSSVTGVLMPGVVKLVESKATPKQLCDEMIRIGRLILMVLGLIWSAFLVFGRQFITLWVGEEKLDAYWVALALMTAQMFILTEAIGTQILWSMNEHKEQSILKISIVVVNIFLTVALMQWHPLYGATLGTFISLMLGDIGVMNFIFVKKIKIKLSTYYLGLFKGIVPCMLIAIAVGFGFSFIGLSGWLGFGADVLAVVAAYMAAMSLFGMNAYEKNLIFGMVKKVFRRPSRKKA